MSSSRRLRRCAAADLAVGSVVGSNVFSTLFVLGITSSIFPVTVPEGGHTDLILMLASGAVLLTFLIRRDQVRRNEGGVLFSCYVGYIVW